MIEKMKDSGIEWIGEIPDEWDIEKLKYLTSQIIDGTHNTPTYVDDGIPFLRVTDITTDDGRDKPIDLGTVARIPLIEHRELSKRCEAKKGDLLVSKNGTIGIPKMVDWNWEFSMFVSLCLIKTNPLLNTKFLYYYFKSPLIDTEIIYGGKTNTITNLHLEKIANFEIPIPPIPEQQAISDFLDKKVGQVDDILTDLNKQVELLNQYRDSVIYEATSKGLNKNNEYQSIDNEWYPQIPAHWRFMAVKRLTSVLTCGVASTPEYVDENNGVLFLSAQNIQNNKLDLSIRKYVPISLHKTLTKNRKPQKGDILQVRVGATIGKCAIVDIDEEFSVYVSLSHIRANQNMHNRFLNYIIGTDMFKEMVSLDIDYAGTQGNLNVADLREVRIPVPPIQEQQAIADYLDKKCTQIDDLIIEKQKQIEKMESYKKSLIYEYVTGKKRVRV